MTEQEKTQNPRSRRENRRREQPVENEYTEKIRDPSKKKGFCRTRA